jgi:Fe-S cluster biogenesis protein NfuA
MTEEQRVDSATAGVAGETLEERIQLVLNGYRPTLYMDGGDVEILKVDEKGIAHVKMLGACIDCPISILTMKLGIQRLLKENFSEVTGVNAITDISIADLYKRQPVDLAGAPPTLAAVHTAAAVGA